MDIAAQQHNEWKMRLAVVGGWGLLFATVVFAYLPGLSGPFLLDDFGSIAALGDLGGVKDWDTFKSFVFGGYAGLTGRPLAMLSFLIDADNWPTDPWPFKRTNLVIHLINGVLLGVLTAKILRLLEFEKRNIRWIALISAACWLLHPFLVSTTLYVVQRMAQLSTLFILAGLVTYIHGRSFLVINATRAYLIMSVAVGLFTFLAMISKENGILLPILVGTIEITIVASQKKRLAALNRYWAFVFIIAPSTVIALYLGKWFFHDDFFRILPPRDFSVYERVLTQPRVLVDYLRHWFFPSLYTSGIYQDHFIKSTGLFSPITTILSGLFHVAIIAIAIINRRKWPLLSLAALFFYGSHILESSVINLELYFEHRNYLATVFLFLPLLVLLQEKSSRRLFLAVSAGVLLLLGGFTRYSATVWESYPSIVEASARKAPTSARAQARYATQLYNLQRYEDSLQVIDRAIGNTSSDNLLLLGNRLVILCEMGELAADDFQQVANVMSGSPYDARLINVFTAFASSVVAGNCPAVSNEALRSMFANMLLVPENGDPKSLQYSQITYFIGFVDVHSGEPSQAAKAFEESLRARPGASHAMKMAAHLATGGFLEEALYFSDLALSQLEVEQRGFLRGARVYESDIKAFQATIRSDMDAQRDADTPRPES